ncbi:MAG: pantoate--beta-alanine ligase [Bacteroidota bacterium]
MATPDFFADRAHLLAMDLLRTVEDMQAIADRARCQGRRLVLVPTMGALHDGHVALVEEAHRQGNHVTVSIFVNPTQFGPGEDYEQYPRTLADDLERLAGTNGGRGVACVFAPTVASMYPLGLPVRMTVEPNGLDRHLCGAHRPGHFQGVTTVVTKLFNACRPHVAVFGRKDAQQFLILRRMARELNTSIELVGVETVREADGLALSSRNRYLTDEERGQAVVLSQALRAVTAAVSAGERDAKALVRALLDHMQSSHLARVQYAEIVDTDTIQPVPTLEPGREALAAVAVFFGSTRLIDNAFLTVPADERP